MIPITPGRMQERPNLVQFSLSDSLVVSMIENQRSNTEVNTNDLHVALLKKSSTVFWQCCLPVLLHGLEACPLTKWDLQSLDFVNNRFSL